MHNNRLLLFSFVLVASLADSTAARVAPPPKTCLEQVELPFAEQIIAALEFLKSAANVEDLSIGDILRGIGVTKDHPNFKTIRDTLAGRLTGIYIGSYALQQLLILDQHADDVNYDSLKMHAEELGIHTDLARNSLCQLYIRYYVVSSHSKLSESNLVRIKSKRPLPPGLALYAPRHTELVCLLNLEISRIRRIPANISHPVPASRIIDFGNDIDWDWLADLDAAPTWSGFQHVETGHVVTIEDTLDRERVLSLTQIDALPSICTEYRELMECRDAVISGLDRMRTRTPPYSIPAILDAIGVPEMHPRRQCALHALRLKLRSFLVSEQALKALLDINRDFPGSRISASAFFEMFKSSWALKTDPFAANRCALHQWYLHVINPFVGKSVKDLNLIAVRDDVLLPGHILYAPNRLVLTQLIESEIRKSLQRGYSEDRKRARDDIAGESSDEEQS